MAYQTFTHQIWWVMVCYDLAHQIRCAKHTFSGWCDIPPMVCCSFGGHSTPQFLQCTYVTEAWELVRMSMRRGSWYVCHLKCRCQYVCPLKLGHVPKQRHDTLLLCIRTRFYCNYKKISSVDANWRLQHDLLHDSPTQMYPARITPDNLLI